MPGHTHRERLPQLRHTSGRAALPSAAGSTGMSTRPIGAFLHDLLHGALHFEGKTWHTLPLLALRPGELTRRYIDGERARFVSPMALFLFSVFLMFAVFQFVGISPPTTSDRRPDGRRGGSDQSLEAQLARRSRSARESHGRRQSGRADASTRRSTAIEQRIEATDRPRRQGRAGAGRQAAATEVRPAQPSRPASPSSTTGSRSGGENPGLMAYKLQSNFYKFSLAADPAVAAVRVADVRLAAALRAYDHAVFVTYSLSFMTLLFVAAGAARPDRRVAEPAAGFAAVLSRRCTSTSSSRAPTACRASRRCGARSCCWCSSS